MAVENTSATVRDVPEGWAAPSPEVLDYATDVALRALSDRGEHPVHQRLSAYYKVRGNYAGASFADMQPIDTGDITATDLFAVTLLSVDVKPGAARRLLDDGPHRQDILANLARLEYTDMLAEADAEMLARMADLYGPVKHALSSEDAKRSNPWVTASKLCARKRPSLFPVRDRNVCDLLRLTAHSNYEIDWQVFRHLVAEADVYMAIDAAAQAVRDLGGEYRVDQHRLRVLDAALWTYTVW